MVSCHYFKPKKTTEHLARVDNVYLDKSEVMQALPNDISAEDSVIFVHNYINKWATEQLLLAGAKRNLPQEKQEEYNAMVKNYRQELYTEAYKDMIIASKMDTSISEQAIKIYYEKNKDNFKLNENLIKLRYLKLAKDYSDLANIKKQFERFNTEDQNKLYKESFKFKASSLNDSVWVKQQLLYKKIALLKEKKNDISLKKGKFITLKDSLSLYLIFIKDVRLRDEQAPLSYIKPTIKQILLNQKKLQFAKQFEKEITKDALEDNKFEIYH